MGTIFRVALLLVLAVMPAAADVRSRVAYAQNLDYEFVKDGFDFSIKTDGENNDVLRVQHIRMNRPMVFKFTESNFLTRAKAAGFRRVTFTNGWGSVWRYDLPVK